MIGEPDPETAALLEKVIARNSVSSVGMDTKEEKMVINFSRDGSGLGISIAGGKGSTPYKGNDEGIFISRVVEGGVAAKNGLTLGDKILAVNSANLENADHLEAVEALKAAGNNIHMVVTREVLVSSETMFQEPPSPKVEVSADEPGLNTSTQPLLTQDNPTADTTAERSGVKFAPEPKFHHLTEKITLKLVKDSNGLGFSIAGGKGSPPFKGTDDSIFISRISEGGAADRTGALSVGDKVLKINNVEMAEARHETAVALLTKSKEIDLVIMRETMEIEHHEPLVKHDPPEFRYRMNGPNSNGPPEELEIEEVFLKRTRGPLGLSIVGGIDHSSHPFGGDEPGIFISKIVPNGSAASTNLRVGDRLLVVNNKEMKGATHQFAVNTLLSNSEHIQLVVRHDPPPKGLIEIKVPKAPGEKLGISIRGGNKGHPGNPLDRGDEGIFISKVNEVGAAARDGRLRVGQRILEVNSQSMLGSRHREAVMALRGCGDMLGILVCDGFDPSEVDYWQSRPGCAGNPLSQVDLSKRNSQESISSIDRDMTTEELNRLNQDAEFQLEAQEFEEEELAKLDGREEEMRRQREEETRRLTEENEENFQKIITRNVSSRSPPLVRQEMMHAQEQEVETDDDELDAPLPRLRSPSEEDLINEDFQMEEELIPLRVDTEIEINSKQQAVTTENGTADDDDDDLPLPQAKPRKKAPPPVAPRPRGLRNLSTSSTTSRSSSVSTPPGSPEPTPPEDPKPATDGPEPSKLAFKDKWKRFEQQIDEQAHSTPKTNTKKVSLVSDQDLQKIKEDEDKKVSVMTPDDLLNYSQGGLDANNTFNASISISPIGAKKDGSNHSELSASELRSREADEKAILRAARMQSLEDDALQAERAIHKTQEINKLKSPETESKPKENGENKSGLTISSDGLNSLDEIQFMDEGDED
eukprot:XP_011663597.1 PREDICTED: protein scribble homolog isoform X2 [Strongylocentrotus purpuratus]